MTTIILEEWHEVRENFNPSKPISINQMHEFKEKLKLEEQTEGNLRLLVDIYCMLRMYSDAYKIFTSIMDLGNKKDQKKFRSIKYYIENPNCVKPLYPREIREDKTIKTVIPTFKYLPDPLKSKIFEAEEVVTCDCCEQEVDVYYTGGIYAIEEVDYLCPTCIHSGAAAKKYDGSFQQYLINNENVVNSDFTEEVMCRTPGYVSWQGNNWMAHCSDYCAFIGYVGWSELVELGITEQFENYTGFSNEELSESLVNNGHHQGYLFQCLQCDRYVLYSDFS
ncbi:CbrC family protein [Lysinibacillus sp. fls2-241-R2A-57]|uniref:CbrC family protein n=1 Tax=Lysinibacillus sp. fls2-241-R2A-57 TaxID=3040292 RepID=UPI0025558F4F|nr:CbrC family protein [Lysinibacillus sp. fls2-241-R2A-57]